MLCFSGCSVLREFHHSNGAGFWLFILRGGGKEISKSFRTQTAGLLQQRTGSCRYMPARVSCVEVDSALAQGVVNRFWISLNRFCKSKARLKLAVAYLREQSFGRDAAWSSNNAAWSCQQWYFWRRICLWAVTLAQNSAFCLFYFVLFIYFYGCLCSSCPSAHQVLKWPRWELAEGSLTGPLHRETCLKWLMEYLTVGNV